MQLLHRLCQVATVQPGDAIHRRGQEMIAVGSKEDQEDTTGLAPLADRIPPPKLMEPDPAIPATRQHPLLVSRGTDVFHPVSGPLVLMHDFPGEVPKRRIPMSQRTLKAQRSMPQGSEQDTQQRG